MDETDNIQALAKSALAFFITNDEDLKEKLPKVPAPFSENYNMNHNEKSIALIFNQMHYTTPLCSTREGSNFDRDILKELFNRMNFDVHVYDDNTRAEVFETLDRVSKIDHSERNCLIIVVMTHGDANTLFASDKPYKTKLLWDKFSGKNCKSLAGKPKLFFIQACRGTGLDTATTVEYSGDIIDGAGDISGGFYTIPEMADILVMYSTTDGYYSWRDPKRGSYFIEALVTMLWKHKNNRDLLTILTFVNCQVAVNFTSHEPEAPELNDYKQMSSIVSMLTRLVHFK